MCEYLAPLLVEMASYRLISAVNMRLSVRISFLIGSSQQCCRIHSKLEGIERNDLPRIAWDGRDWLTNVIIGFVLAMRGEGEGRREGWWAMGKISYVIDGFFNNEDAWIVSDEIAYCLLFEYSILTNFNSTISKCLAASTALLLLWQKRFATICLRPWKRSLIRVPTD